MRPLWTTILTFALSVSFAQDLPRIHVESPTLKAGQTVPVLHTPDGKNESPALRWSSVPGAKEFMVFCEDPGVGNPPPFVHWVVYKIPASASQLPAALPIDDAALPAPITGAIQGLNGFRRAIYRGPAPPRGKAHDYHFVVLALDQPIEIPQGQPPLTRAQLLAAAAGHVIARGELVAIYERK